MAVSRSPFQSTCQEGSALSCVGKETTVWMMGGAAIDEALATPVKGRMLKSDQGSLAVFAIVAHGQQGLFQAGAPDGDVLFKGRTISDYL